MLNYDEIRGEVERLEHSPTTYANVEKLAMLYQVLNNAPDQAERSERSAPVQKYSYASDSDSEFVRAVQDAPLEDVLTILDEHMDAVRILYPKEYSMVIRKISELKDRR